VDEDRHGDERQHELDGAHGQGGEFPRCAGRHGEDDKNGADGRALHGRIIVVVMRLRRDGKEIFQRFI
jgi:hypothetical protein